MTAIHAIASAAITLGLTTSVGERLPPAPAPSPEAVQPPIEGMPLFAVFGWAGPPTMADADQAYDDFALAGFNLVFPALDDTGGYLPSAPQLDLAAPRGLKVLVWDPRFENVQADNPASRDLVEAIAADYRDHPAMAGYYLGDEPPPDLFERLGAVHQWLREIDPEHRGWNNLLGRQAFSSRADLEAYTRSYGEHVNPRVLCNDHYDFERTGDRGLFVENLAALELVARERGVPFWGIVQLTEHALFRGLRDGELRWQVSHLLAYGARGVGYFTYATPPPNALWNWQPAVIDRNGQRTHWFDVLAEFNPRVRAAGETLAGLAWLGAEFAGSAPAGGQTFTPDDWVARVDGRAAMGYFTSANDRYLLVTNSDSLETRTVGLTLPGTVDVLRLGRAPGDWARLPVRDVTAGVRVDLTLAAGDFALLALRGESLGDVTAGSAPGLILGPNPARSEIRLSVEAAARAATLEILDAGGRRVWARVLAPGRTALRWRGERDAGGFVAPGHYFVRIEDARGATVRRLTWLGR